MVLKTHITGAIMHGQSNSFYIDLNQWPHDPNMTITCLLNSLCRGRRSFPPKLYIQCDNCGRENKNKYVLGFLAYLCVAGYVKEASIDYLTNGSTMLYQANEIDQRRTDNIFAERKSTTKPTFLIPPKIAEYIP